MIASFSSPTVPVPVPVPGRGGDLHRQAMRDAVALPFLEMGFETGREPDGNLVLIVRHSTNLASGRRGDQDRYELHLKPRNGRLARRPQRSGLIC